MFLTPESLKEKAPILRKFMKENYNVDVSLGHSLEVISKILGHKDWNTASAALKSMNKKESIPDFIKTVGDLKKAIGPYKDSAQVEFHSILNLGGVFEYMKNLEIDDGVLLDEYSLIRDDANDDRVKFYLKLKDQQLGDPIKVEDFEF